MSENDDHPLTERSNFTDNSPTYSTERSIQCVTDPEFDFSYADDPTGIGLLFIFNLCNSLHTYYRTLQLVNNV